MYYMTQLGVNVYTSMFPDMLSISACINIFLFLGLIDVIWDNKLTQLNISEC